MTKKSKLATVDNKTLKKLNEISRDAMADPFAYLSTLKNKSSTTNDNFDPDNIGKSGHQLISSGDFGIQDEVDIAKTIREVVDSKTIVPRDMKVDDSSIPQAKNLVEWVSKDKFAMINNERPYIEQLTWGVIVFNEACPNCSDLEYLYHDHEVSDTYEKFNRKVQCFENGVCPSCGLGRSQAFLNGDMNFMTELAVSAGQRSGKSLSVAGYFAPYLTHRLLKLQNPNAFYNLKTGTMLHCTFVALTYAQAKDTLWQNYYATLTESEWFKEYHSMLTYYGDYYGEKLLKFNDTYVAYPARGLMAYPAGPDKRVLRGRTRFFSSVDEVGWFDSNKDSSKVKDNAFEVVGALDRSLLTVRGAAEYLIKNGFNDVYPGYGMNVSSPSHLNDYIMHRVRQAENSPSIYGVIRPTWEVNPTLPRNSAVITQAYIDDEINAERDYGAQPPLAASPFIKSQTAIKESFGKKSNSASLKKLTKMSKRRGESETYASIKKTKVSKFNTLMAIDAGLNNNSFAGVIGRLDDNFEVKVNVVFEIIPEPGTNLNHSAIFDEVLVPLMNKWKVRALLADRWNSVKLLQDAADVVELLEHSDQYSLKYRDMYNLHTHITQNTITLPKLEIEFQKCLEFDSTNYPFNFEGKPVAHLALQMATVKDTKKKVDKGDGFTDDTYRALSLLTWALDQEKYQEALNLPLHEEVSTFRVGAIGASRLNSGGGMQIGNDSGGGPARMIGVISQRRN